MNIQNITGLEKPLEKLVQVIDEGVGVLGNHIFEFDVKKIERTSQAQANSQKQLIIKEAEGSAEALGILDRAGKRFALEQYSRQINLENIIVKTRNHLSNVETVSDKSVDTDWSSKFINVAQCISNEDLQNILASILANEIIAPGNISMRTLEIVKNLSKADLELFSKLVLLSDDGTRVFVSQDNTNHGFFDFSYSDLLSLIEIGLIHPNLSTVLYINNVKEGDTFDLKIDQVTRTFEYQRDTDQIRLPLISFTVVGKDIARSIIDLEETNDLKRVKDYMNKLAFTWEKVGIKEHEN